MPAVMVSRICFFFHSDGPGNTVFIKTVNILFTLLSHAKKIWYQLLRGARQILNNGNSKYKIVSRSAFRLQLFPVHPRRWKSAMFWVPAVRWSTSRRQTRVTRRWPITRFSGVEWWVRTNMNGRLWMRRLGPVWSWLSIILNRYRAISFVSRRSITSASVNSARRRSTSPPTTRFVFAKTQLFLFYFLLVAVATEYRTIQYRIFVVRRYAIYKNTTVYQLVWKLVNG